MAVPPTEPASPKAEDEAEVVEVVADAEPGSGSSSKSETEEKQQQQPGASATTTADGYAAEDAANREDADLKQRTSSPLQSASDETDLERIRTAAEEKTAVTASHHPPPPPPPRHHPAPVRSSSAHSLSSTHPPGKFDKPEEPAFAPDGTPYVGDGTWEERTWKELTRLREDVFWARVGRAQ